ncbi:MAG: CRISPR-associated endonuclease Cas2 [Bacteroidota bacterium]
MLVLVVYDVPDDRDRTRWAHELEGFGRRVQYSVFECHLTARRYRELRQRVKAFVAQTDDASVRCYRLCATCQQRVETFGKGPDVGDAAYFIA